MSRRLLIVLIIIAISGTAFGYLIFGKSDKSVEQYKISELTRGDIESTISSTGTLSPITTVQVGTQVSGTIAEVFVDYNYKVKKGQMLAVLDTVLLKISVLDAQAGVDRADAQLEQAQADFDRNQALFDQKLISDSDFLPYRVALDLVWASCCWGDWGADLRRKTGSGQGFSLWVWASQLFPS